MKEFRNGRIGNRIIGRLGKRSFRNRIRNKGTQSKRERERVIDKHVGTRLKIVMAISVNGKKSSLILSYSSTDHYFVCNRDKMLKKDF